MWVSNSKEQQKPLHPIPFVEKRCCEKQWSDVTEKIHSNRQFFHNNLMCLPSHCYKTANELLANPSTQYFFYYKDQN